MALAKKKKKKKSLDIICVTSLFYFYLFIYFILFFFFFVCVGGYILNNETVFSGFESTPLRVLSSHKTKNKSECKKLLTVNPY